MNVKSARSARDLRRASTKYPSDAASCRAMLLDRALHFDIGPKQRSNVPFHLGLALSNTELTATHRHSQDRGRLIAAARLKAIGEPELINIDAGVERLYRDDEINISKARRQLAAEVQEALTRPTCQRNEHDQHCHLTSHVQCLRRRGIGFVRSRSPPSGNAKQKRPPKGGHSATLFC
jgi:hypothetical protein